MTGGRTVTTRFVAFTILTPAGTAAAVPLRTSPNVGDVILQQVRLRIPPGHSGLTGIRVDYASTTILPFSNPSAWIVADDYKDSFVVGIEVGNSLQLVTYNTDVSDHTFYGLLEVTDITDGAPAPTAFVPIVAT